MDAKGNFYYTQLNKINSENITLNNIKKNVSVYKARDFLIHDDTIYLSAVTKENDCQFIKIYKSKIDFENLDLTEVFQKNFVIKI